jgi:hypothetical protein
MVSAWNGIVKDVISMIRKITIFTAAFAAQLFNYHPEFLYCAVRGRATG